MLNLESIQHIAMISLGSVTGIVLAAVIKSYFFKKKITSEDMYIALYLLIAVPLASFIREHYAIDTISWKAFWAYAAVFATAQLVAQLGRCLFARCVK